MRVLYVTYWFDPLYKNLANQFCQSSHLNRPAFSMSYEKSQTFSQNNSITIIDWISFMEEFSKNEYTFSLQDFDITILNIPCENWPLKAKGSDPELFINKSLMLCFQLPESFLSEPSLSPTVFRSFTTYIKGQLDTNRVLILFNDFDCLEKTKHYTENLEIIEKAELTPFLQPWNSFKELDILLFLNTVSDMKWLLHDKQKPVIFRIKNLANLPKIFTQIFSDDAKNATTLATISNSPNICGIKNSNLSIIPLEVERVNELSTIIRSIVPHHITFSESSCIWIDNMHKIELSPGEFDLFKYLAKKSGIKVKQNDLLKELVKSSDSLKSELSSLRTKVTEHLSYERMKWILIKKSKHFDSTYMIPEGLFKFSF